MKKQILPLFIALSALSVSGSAAFYSVSGLSKLFAGASFEVIIMASSLEVSKLVIASLLYQYWDTINKFLRTYLVTAAIILVLITSMGIYGFLSAAYQDTYRNLSVKDNKIAFLTQKKDFYESDVLRYDQELERISNNIATLSGARASSIQVRDTASSTGYRNTISTTELRLSQRRIAVEEENRKNVQAKREIVADSLQKYQLSILNLENDSAVTGELGPLQYLSGLTGVPMDKIINVLLLVIIFVFDPLAISLVVAANFAFDQANPKKKFRENLYGELEEEKPVETKEEPSIMPKKEKITYTEQEAVDFFDEIEKEIEEEKEPDKSELYSQIDEDRMNVIGQNGNEGLHYEEEVVEEEPVEEEVKVEEPIEEKKEEDDGWDIVDEEENVIVQTSQSTPRESIKNLISEKQLEIEKLGTYTSGERRKNELLGEIKNLNRKLNNEDDDETIIY